MVDSVVRNMSITITGVISVIIIALFMIIGVKNGLIKQIFDLFAFFITWALTWILYPYLASVLLKTPVYDFVSGWLIMTLNNNDLISASLPEFFSDLPLFIKDSIVISSKQAFENVISSTAEALSVLTVNILSIIILFIALRILSSIIKKIGKNINKIILIGPFNMLLGGAFGVLKGVFIVYIALMIISFLPTTGLYERVSKDFQSSYIINIMVNEKTDFMGLSQRWQTGENI